VIVVGAMNATGWALVVCAGGSGDELFDFAGELCARLGTDNAPAIHGLHLERDRGETRRYCFHPTGQVEHEFRGDDLREALMAGVMWLSQQLDPHEMWRRD
jgi:hypothetical protein